MTRQAPRSRVGAALNALPIGIALTLLAALPSFLNLATDQIFEEQKALLLKGAAVMALPGVLMSWRGPALRRLLERPAVLLFLALVATLSLSTLINGMGHDAVFGAYLRRHGLSLWIALAVLFVAMVTAAQSATGRTVIVRAVVVGACWPAAYLLLQRAGLDAYEWIAPNEGYQSGGTFGSRVLLGGYLALSIPLAVSEAWRSHRGWWAAAALQAAALVMSGGRGAAIALVAAAVTGLGVLLWRRAGRRVALGVTAAAVATVIAVAFIPALRPAALVERLNPQVGSARVRVLIWQDTVDILRTSGARLFLGHGPERLRSLFPAHYSPEIGRWEQIDAMPDRAHNETLDMLVTGGVIGALLQLAFFAVTLIGALRVGDVYLQAGLAAAIVGHVVEIQFGIASAGSRLSLMAVAATVVGAQLPDAGDARPPAATSAWLVIAAIAGALSPWLSALPFSLNNPIASGSEADFVQYLGGLAAATAVLYVGGLLLALGIASSWPANRRPAPSPWWQVPALAMAAWLVVPLSIVPSRADAYAAAARSYERQQRWPETSIAFGAAAREAPAIPDYDDGAARASMLWALNAEPPRREQLLAQARTAYERAITSDPFEPLYRRHLAAYFRVEASLLQGTDRERALQHADRLLSELSAAAPTLPPVWIEWAWVDVDRRRPADALAKLGRALALNPDRADAKRLQAELLAQGLSMDAR